MLDKTFLVWVATSCKWGQQWRNG